MLLIGIDYCGIFSAVILETPSMMINTSRSRKALTIERKARNLVSNEARVIHCTIPEQQFEGNRTIIAECINLRNLGFQLKTFMKDTNYAPMYPCPR